MEVEGKLVVGNGQRVEEAWPESIDAPVSRNCRLILTVSAASEEGWDSSCHPQGSCIL